MSDQTEHKTRDSLPPQLRAISDTLDEWLHRMHGSISSWQSPDYFLEWLEKRGWMVVKTTELEAVKAREEAATDYILAMLKHDDAMAFDEYQTMDEHNKAVENIRGLQAKWRALDASEPPGEEE